jgi:NADH:ubiquinone oxidoreductase subunit E
MLELCVCIGSSCHIKGAYNLIQTFQQLIEEKDLHDRINFKSSFCMRQCRNPGVAVSVDGQIHHVTSGGGAEFFRKEVEARLNGKLPNQ